MSNKIIYPALAVFAGNSPATGAQANLNQLYRVTQVANEFQVKHTPVTVLGQYESIDEVIIEPAAVSMDISYIVTNVLNEQSVGLYVSGDSTVLKYMLDGSQFDKNYFIRIVPNGQAAVGYTGIDGGVVSVGNAVLSSYSTKGAVGQFPTSDLKFQALNAKYDISSSGIDTPAVNPQNGLPLGIYSVTIPTAVSGLFGQLSALRPGDITVNLNGGGIGISGVAVQNYNIGLNMRLVPFQGLGDKFPESYEIEFPVQCTMQIEGSMRLPGVGNLANTICSDTKYDLSVTLRAPTCDGTTGATQAVYTLKGAKLVRQSNDTTIGPARSVRMEFEAPIGGPTVITRGLFISGALV